MKKGRNFCPYCFFCVGSLLEIHILSITGAGFFATGRLEERKFVQNNILL
jgi:hypothetical protein